MRAVLRGFRRVQNTRCAGAGRPLLLAARQRQRPLGSVPRECKCLASRSSGNTTAATRRIKAEPASPLQAQFKIEETWNSSLNSPFKLAVMHLVDFSSAARRNWMTKARYSKGRDLRYKRKSRIVGSNVSRRRWCWAIWGEAIGRTVERAAVLHSAIGAI